VFMFKLLLLLSLLLLLLLLLLLFAFALLLIVEMALADKLKVIMRKLRKPKAEKLWHLLSRPKIDSTKQLYAEKLDRFTIKKKYLFFKTVWFFVEKVVGGFDTCCFKGRWRSRKSYLTMKQININGEDATIMRTLFATLHT